MRFYSDGLFKHELLLLYSNGTNGCGVSLCFCFFFLLWPSITIITRLTGTTLLRFPPLTEAMHQLLSITCSKMNEDDGLRVTTPPVYIYFNRYSGEKEEEEEDKQRQKASLNVHVKLSSGLMPSVSG